eukprot:TRINITY_DN50099_c0_g1_i1.p2 TRINITY_DN50099_c0_g1~~TRINITY_DN50099_c0_g1_i1.p2  ORF type:complete len:555 (+),score=108.69 TRINITY_DN50099_c0_g1_i1:1864-3528(+)
MAMCGAGTSHLAAGSQAPRAGGGYLSPLRTNATTDDMRGRTKARLQSPPPRQSLVSALGGPQGPVSSVGSTNVVMMKAVTPRSLPHQEAGGVHRMNGANAGGAPPQQVTIAGAAPTSSPSPAPQGAFNVNVHTVRQNGSTTAFHRDGAVSASQSPPRPPPQGIMDGSFFTGTSSSSHTTSVQAERSRSRNLEQQLSELMVTFERVKKEAETESQKAAQAQRRLEEQQLLFNEELNRERARALRLEESFGGLTGAVEQLTQQAEAAVKARSGQEGSGDDGMEVSLLKARVALLEKEVESAQRRAESAEKGFEAKESECRSMRQELQKFYKEFSKERAENDSLQVSQAEQVGKLQEYLQTVLQESNRRAETISEKQALIEEFQAERTAWNEHFQILEKQVETLQQEKVQALKELESTEARLQKLAFDKDQLGSEVMSLMRMQGQVSVDPTELSSTANSRCMSRSASNSKVTSPVTTSPTHTGTGSPIKVMSSSLANQTISMLGGLAAIPSTPPKGASMEDMAVSPPTPGTFLETSNGYIHSPPITYPPPNNLNGFS